MGIWEVEEKAREHLEPFSNNLGHLLTDGFVQKNTALLLFIVLVIAIMTKFLV